MGSLVFVAIITFIIIIALAAIGGMLTEKAGVTNLSIEGFMTIGAIAYALLTHMTPKFGGHWGYQWITMPLAGLITAAFSLIYSLATVKLRANQTIAGIALNTLAISLSMFLIKVRGDNRLNLNLQIWSVTEDKLKLASVFNIALFIGVPIIVLFILWLGYSKYGKRIRAVGENPSAAASLGINVLVTRTVAITISAFIVGIAGAMFAQKIDQFYRGSVQGIGFLAVAIVIFGQWKPLLILGGAVLFGALYGIAQNAVLITGLSTIAPQEIINMIPYIVSLIVLIFTSKNSKAPKAIGIPYVNQGR